MGHQLAVVGIFFDVTNETNPAFEAIFEDHLDNVQYPHKRPFSEIVHGLDLKDLIPDDIGTAGYFAYEGSLTTPPCTNIVRWHVMNARASISAAQMAKFRGLMMDRTNKTLAPNYRETMPEFNQVYACTSDAAVLSGEGVDNDGDFDEGWIVAIIAIIAAVSFLFCFVLKTWKSNELQKELNEVGTGPMRNRGRVLSISEDNRKEVKV